MGTGYTQRKQGNAWIDCDNCDQTERNEARSKEALNIQGRTEYIARWPQ